MVAHHFFEHIIDDAKATANGASIYQTLRDLTDNQFDSYLEAAINATGLIMLLDENATQLHNFKWQLKMSMQTLIDIMEHLQLEPVDCEIAFPQEDEELKLDTIGDFGARIDFLLLDPDKNYVIFDFKWSFSKRYPRKLEENTSIQLELYRQTIIKTYPKKEVKGVGYYIMPMQTLYTTDFDSWKTCIKKVNAGAESTLFKQIQKSYEFRKAELSEGKIEDGELMSLTSCLYAEKEIDKENPENNLIPLERNDQDKTLKASEYVFLPTKKKTRDYAPKEPNETPTSHSILKGRVK